MPSRQLLDPTHKPLDFNSLKELPESFAWGPPEPEVDSGPDSVPIVDLECKSAVDLIGQACKRWGVFQVVNHGVPSRVLESIEFVAMSLFGLAVQQKLKVAKSTDGVSGYGPVPIASFFPKKMWSEGFTVAGSPRDHARILWPHDYVRFSEMIEEYQIEMNQLAEKIMGLVMGSLGLSKSDLKWVDPNSPEFDDPTSALQLNSYPSCPDPSRAMGMATHTDSSLITILYQNITGLQVLRPEGTGWVTVQPDPSRLVVNLGDLFHILSNGSYPSAVHRVMVNQANTRISVAYFHGPPSKVQIAPHPKLTGTNRPPLYKPVAWKEYIGIRAKHFNNALASIRVNPNSIISECNSVNVTSNGNLNAAFG